MSTSIEVVESFGKPQGEPQLSYRQNFAKLQRTLVA